MVKTRIPIVYDIDYSLYQSLLTSLETKDRQFDNLVVTGGTASCRNDKQVVAMTTYSSTRGDKVVKLTILCFQWFAKQTYGLILPNLNVYMFCNLYFEK